MSSKRSNPRSSRASAPSSKNGRGLVFGGLALVVVVAVAIALLAGGGDDDGGSASAAVQETADVTVAGTSLPAFPGNGEADPAVGDTVPTIEGEDFEGSAVTLAPDGTPQVVMVVVHSCPHCQAEVPRVVELAAEGAFDGVTVTIVPTGTSEQAANYPPSSWLEREEWPFRVLLDDEESAAARALGTSSVPYLVFLDAEGRVAGRLAGETDPADLEAIVAALRAGDPLPLPGATGGSTSTG